jgi:hypothetical protein
MESGSKMMVNLAPHRSRAVVVVYALNALFIAVAWTYFVSHRFTANRIIDGIYETQATSLAHGSLSILSGPMQIFYHDAVMYFGQNYFYQGLLPSLTLMTLSALVGQVATHYLIVFACFFSIAYFFQRLLGLLVESAESDVHRSRLTLPVGAALASWVLLFTIPYPMAQGWFFDRFVVYEQQILFGLALALPGMYFLIQGLRGPSVRALALATLMFSLASWTRVTWFPFAFLVLGIALARLWRRDRVGSHGPHFTALVLGPPLLLLAGLLAINYVRFGSPLDFGIRYQNPVLWEYFRTLKLYFSPATRLWNAVFNVACYFAPTAPIERLGLMERSFAFIEDPPISFFWHNPHFLILVALMPLGFYRAAKRRNGIVVPFLVLSGTVLYLNVILGIYGTAVILRFFVEFWYFLVLAFFGVILMFLRPRYALPLLALMLAPYIPGVVRRFVSVQPELRTIQPKDGGGLFYQSGGTFFVDPDPSWPQGKMDAHNFRQTRPYAAIGMGRGAGETLIAMDICGVYLVPEAREDTKTGARLEVRQLRSLEEIGTVRVFVENRLVATQAVRPDKPVDLAVELPFSLPRVAPYQIVLLFLRDGESYLTARSSLAPQMMLDSISLSTSSTGANSHP